MDERTFAAELDRFLEELVAGNGANSRMFDPEISRIARRYRSIGQSPAPVGARDRVWRRLDQQAQPGEQTLLRIPVSSNGHGPSHVVSTPRPHVLAPARWRNVAYIAAAIALFALGAVSALLASNWGDEQRPNSIPAVSAPEATNAPNQTLEDAPLSFTLPEELFPQLNGGGSTLFQATIPEGASWSWLAKTDPCCKALIVEYVLSGSFTIRFHDDPVNVMRDGGPLQTIAAGTEISIGPGDTLISNTGFGHSGENSSATPVQLLRWDFFPGTSSEIPIPSHWIVNADNAHFFLAQFEPGPARMTLRQVELQVEETYQVEPGVRPDLVFAVPMNVNDAGEHVVTNVADLGDGRILNFGDEVITLYVLTLEPLAEGAAGPSGSSPDS